MGEMKTIPKLLSPRTVHECPQKVPRIIWQTLKTNLVPAPVKEYADSWINLNPEYEYRFFDDADIESFISCNYPEYLDGYHKLKYGASKADLWRYLVIYKYGGVYADLDCLCLNPLRNWVKPDSSFVTQLGTNQDLCQWLIISEPENPILLKAAQMTLENVKNGNHNTPHHGFELIKGKLAVRQHQPMRMFNHPVLGLSGPPVMQAAAEECFKEGSITELLPYIDVVCVSEKISCQMGGNVIHDTGNKKRKEILKVLKTVHYDNVWEKVKRKLGMR